MAKLSREGRLRGQTKSCLGGAQVSVEEGAVKPCSFMWSENPLCLVEENTENVTFHVGPAHCLTFPSLDLAPISKPKYYNPEPISLVFRDIRGSSIGRWEIPVSSRGDLAIAVLWVCQVQRRLLYARIRGTRATGVSEVPGAERLQVCLGLQVLKGPEDS